MNKFEGKIIRAKSEQLTLPDGQIATMDIVHHPGGACILPIDKNNNVILIYQWRPAINNYVWEIPAGKLDDGEKPLECAKRELEEEVGLKAKEWTPLLSFFTTPGFCNEKLHIFIARDFVPTKINREQHEIIEVHKFKLKEIEQMISNEEIKDSKTLIALLMWKNNLT